MATTARRCSGALLVRLVGIDSGERYLERARFAAKVSGFSVQFRVNGVVSNVPEFASAFHCAERTPMAPAARGALW